jgi:hypothetical protein
MGPTANTVVLANGAIVDLNQLGALIAQFCPAFACQPGVVQQTTATAGVQTVQATPVISAQPVNLTQMATSITPAGVSQVQQTFTPDQALQIMNQFNQMAMMNQMAGQAMAQTAFRNMFDLWDG